MELSDTLDSALRTFGRLKEAGARVQRAQDANRAAPKPLDPDLPRAQVEAQGDLFDTLEAFLAAFARVSLLLHPIGSGSYTKLRGTTLRHCLGVEDDSPLENRALRDSWTHHDERMDAAVEAGQGALGQQFSRSTESPRDLLDSTLRVIEIDTLVVHFWKRDKKKGRMKDAADLCLIAQALAEVREAMVANPFVKLAHPPE